MTATAAMTPGWAGAGPPPPPLLTRATVLSSAGDTGSGGGGGGDGVTGTGVTEGRRVVSGGGGAGVVVVTVKFVGGGGGGGGSVVGLSQSNHAAFTGTEKRSSNRSRTKNGGNPRSGVERNISNDSFVAKSFEFFVLRTKKCDRLPRWKFRGFFFFLRTNSNATTGARVGNFERADCQRI